MRPYRPSFRSTERKGFYPECPALKGWTSPAARGRALRIQFG